MKIPEPIGVVVESRKTISTAFATKLYTRSHLEAGDNLYDKQALIDLLEEAAKECIKYGEDSGDLQWMADHLRKQKETL
jgi:hypothetical protein